jgi:hypothetical protein
VTISQKIIIDFSMDMEILTIILGQALLCIRESDQKCRRLNLLGEDVIYKAKRSLV